MTATCTAPPWEGGGAVRAGPGTGIYDIAYDIWLNGVPGNREIMIWTENHGQIPSGAVAKGLSFSGQR